MSWDSVTFLPKHYWRWLIFMERAWIICWETPTIRSRILYDIPYPQSITHMPAAYFYMNGGDAMTETKRRVVRRRMVLGMLLLVCALALAWLPAGEGHSDIPMFGYDENNAPLPAPEVYAAVQPRYFEGFMPLPEVYSAVLGETTLFAPLGDASVPQRARLNITPEYMAQLSDFGYLRSRIFLEDPSTMLLPDDIDAEAFLAADLRIDPTLPGPHVLIFHTHAIEWFVDTERYNPETGIVRVGEYLARILSSQYGLEVLHHTGNFSNVDGRPQVMGSYERMEPVITALLAENPQIQFVIDLHRDGVRDGVGPFTRYIDGVPTARLMFFNGLSRRNVNGQPVPVAWLPNPYQQENLMLSFQAQLAANQRFPNFNRRIYLRAYRFSLHMHPRTLFVEVGNQYNTIREAKNAMHLLAQIIADVLLP